MTIVWLFVALVVLAVVLPLVRAELVMRRRAELELPPELTGPARARAKRAKLAELKYERRHRTSPDAGGEGSVGQGGG